MKAAQTSDPGYIQQVRFAFELYVLIDVTTLLANNKTDYRVLNFPVTLIHANAIIQKTEYIQTLGNFFPYTPPYTLYTLFLMQ